MVPYLTKKSRVKVSSGWRALDGHGALLNLYHGGVTIAESCGMRTLVSASKIDLANLTPMENVTRK